MVYLLQKPRHTIERCWKLHAKPPKGGQLGGQNQAYMTSIQQQGEQKLAEHKEQGDGLEFNREKIEKLRNFLNSLDKKEKGTCSLALIGMSPHSLTLHASRTTQSNSWILDFGATDHMTHLPHYFITYSP